MMLFETNLKTLLLSGSSFAVLGCVVLLVLWQSRYWYKQSHLRNIPGPPAQSFALGNLPQVFGLLEGWDFHVELAETYGRVAKSWGFFGGMQLHISDPKALYSILIKDQEIFEEPDVAIESNKLFFGMGILSTLGGHHRRQRKLLSPVFHINHMRYMMPTFYKITHKLNDLLSSRLANGPQELDILEWMTRVALELIGQGGLGYSFETLEEGKTNRYTTAVKMLFPTAGKIKMLLLILPYLSNIGTAAFRRWIIRLIPSKNIQALVEAADTMDESSKKIFDEKKAALKRGDDAVVHQIGEGRDILSILMQANMVASEADKLPDHELLGQITSLVFAAMDTTSNALSRTFSLLAKNPEVQEKLRQELVNARKEAGGDLEYDALHELPYLEAVCRETLRCFPPVPIIPRVARSDAILPLGSPVKCNDGRTITEIFVPKGTSILINIPAVNTDPGTWGPDAAEWKPERWLSPLPETVADARIPGVYSNMLTFLGGGRSCIGFKFSQMEMKMVLLLLVPNFRFSLGEKRVEWLMGPVSSPVVSGTSKPSLPMIVSQIKRDANGEVRKD
ncbi:cytochrome P450 [Stereum hirsutum FP-91666 SS1]|uniref:cytochrome P450 n=1 Tax=Stereum hirsutum (strain FP-91666) TaxID=721885 RepID=UPI000440C91E|nr:cytochrome P450 [Stereum hirsutum FP-91666 SS1]EIM90577.1 cytochrome P450 [Stereum hirsutum FP-91666 SS1]